MGTIPRLCSTFPLILPHPLLLYDFCRSRPACLPKCSTADTGNNRVLKLRVQNDQQNNSPLEIFDTFKAALDANDVNAAIDCFSDVAKETYSVVLPQLQSKFSEMVG